MNFWHYLLIFSILIIILGAILIYLGYASNGWWTVAAGVVLLISSLVIIFIEHSYRLNETERSDSQLLQGSLEAVPSIPIN